MGPAFDSRLMHLFEHYHLSLCFLLILFALECHRLTDDYVYAQILVCLI